jgi:hypothetical protein
VGNGVRRITPWRQSRTRSIPVRVFHVAQEKIVKSPRRFAIPVHLLTPREDEPAYVYVLGAGLKTGSALGTHMHEPLRGQMFHLRRAGQRRREHFLAYARRRLTRIRNQVAE